MSKPGSPRYKRYVITDIHGCADTFRSLVYEILQPGPEDHLYLLGDYIDRGPASKEVLDLILELSAKGRPVYPLRGNHEQFLLDSLEDGIALENWAEYNGGNTTLQSFGVNHPRDIPQKYLAFLAGLRFYITLDDYYLVHAGFNFNAPDPFKDRDAMLAIRNFHVGSKDVNGRKILHGHTPVPLKVIKDNLKNENVLSYNLDAGCVYRTYPGLGHLVALELNTWKLFTRPAIDEVKW